VEHDGKTGRWSCLSFIFEGLGEIRFSMQRVREVEVGEVESQLGKLSDTECNFGSKVQENGTAGKSGSFLVELP
jgi:hypothetical protein